MGVDRAIDITAKQLKIVTALLERHLPGTAAWIYGSRAKWTARPQSDLDLVVFATPKQNDQIGALREAFEESDLPFRVDLFVWDKVPDQFRKQIQTEHLVLVAARHGEPSDGRHSGVSGETTTNSTLNDYFTLQRGTTYRSRLLGEPGPVLLGLATIQRNGGFRTDSLRTYGGESPDRLLVQPGELYVSLKDVTQSADLLGAVARLPFDHPPGRLTQDTVKLTPRRADTPIDYLYWLLRTQEYRGYCRAHATGTTNLGLSREDFLAFQAPAPTPYQRRIVDTLGTLDDKIELNRRMNKTLEALALALFTSWFVTFDPVRAKMAGRDPGLPKHIADLFPDRLVESELGEIPESWEVATLDSVAENPQRGIQAQQIPLGTPYVALEHMPKRCIALSEWSTADGVASNKLEFTRGDILFGKLRPYFHKVGVAPLDGVCSTDIVIISPADPDWYGFVVGHVSSSAFVDYTNAGSIGTKMPRTKWSDMARYGIALPNQALANEFTQRIAPWIEHVVAAIHESSTLAALRDTLLSRLVSGEVRVKVTDRRIEEAM